MIEKNDRTGSINSLELNCNSSIEEKISKVDTIIDEITDKKREEKKRKEYSFSKSEKVFPSVIIPDYVNIIPKRERNIQLKGTYSRKFSRVRKKGKRRLQ